MGCAREREGEALVCVGRLRQRERGGLECERERGEGEWAGARVGGRGGREVRGEEVPSRSYWGGNRA